MNKRIIFPNGKGGIAIISPAPCGLTIEQLAQKDVPAGVPYLIVDLADIADVISDRKNREAWEADFSKPDGHGMGAEAWLAANQPVEKSPAPVVGSEVE